MVDASSSQPGTCYYFVDEAGDGTLFNKKKQVVVGEEGCSARFILGALSVFDPKGLHSDLETLRATLLADPYLAKIPSLRPEQGKSALAFHAKDDCPEVRREVYRLLMRHEMQFFAVVRDKVVIAAKVREHNKSAPTYRYHPDQLYDSCVSRLFRGRLQPDRSYVIQFSRRGNRARTAALQHAVEQARSNLRAKWRVEATPPIEIMSAKPAVAGGLQAVDYFLWALQRLYERGEDRYWAYVADKATIVHDVDDTRLSDDGVCYTTSNPLKMAGPKK